MHRAVIAARHRSIPILVMVFILFFITYSRDFMFRVRQNRVRRSPQTFANRGTFYFPCLIAELRVFWLIFSTGVQGHQDLELVQQRRAIDHPHDCDLLLDHTQ